MKRVVADREVIDADPREGSEPLLRVVDGIRPVRVGDDPSLEPGFLCFLHSPQHGRIVKKGFTPFKIDRVNALDAFRFDEDLPELWDCHHALGVGATVDKTVIALIQTSVGQEEMQSICSVHSGWASQLDQGKKWSLD